MLLLKEPWEMAKRREERETVGGRVWDVNQKVKGDRLVGLHWLL